MSADALCADLNSQYYAWLEKVAPGAYAAERVTGMSFSDFKEVNPPAGDWNPRSGAGLEALGRP
jgi:hypothetical protein